MSKIVDGLTRYTERIVWGIVLIEVLFSDALSSTADFRGTNAFGHPPRILRPLVGPAFALTFWGVFFITIPCGVANITMAAQFDTAWNMGVGPRPWPRRAARSFSVPPWA
jgi:hypothetical protein